MPSGASMVLPSPEISPQYPGSSAACCHVVPLRSAAGDRCRGARIPPHRPKDGDDSTAWCDPSRAKSGGADEAALGVAVDQVQRADQPPSSQRFLESELGRRGRTQARETTCAGRNAPDQDVRACSCSWPGSSASTLEEAALDLGTTPFKVFWTITLPYMRPAILSAVALFPVLRELQFFPMFIVGKVRKGVQRTPTSSPSYW